jgi:hypothetical protein
MIKKNNKKAHTGQLFWNSFKPKIRLYLLSIWFVLLIIMVLIEGKPGPLEKKVPKIIFSSAGIIIVVFSFLPLVSRFLRSFLLRPDIEFDDDVRFVFKLVMVIGLLFTIPLILI